MSIPVAPDNVSSQNGVEPDTVATNVMDPTNPMGPTSPPILDQGIPNENDEDDYSTLTPDYYSESNPCITMLPAWFKALPNYLLVAQVMCMIQALGELDDFMSIKGIRRYMSWNTVNYDGEIIYKLRCSIYSCALCYCKDRFTPEQAGYCKQAIDILQGWNKEKKFNEDTFQHHWHSPHEFDELCYMPDRE